MNDHESIFRGHTEVGKPVKGRHEMIRNVGENLKDLWSDESFQKTVKKVLRPHAPRQNRRDKSLLGMRPQNLAEEAPLAQDVPESPTDISSV